MFQNHRIFLKFRLTLKILKKVRILFLAVLKESSGYHFSFLFVNRTNSFSSQGKKRVLLYVFSLSSVEFLSVFDNRQLTDSSSKSVDNVFTEARLVLVAALPNKTNHVQLDTE